MPIYEYECTECGDVSEVIQKFNDEPLSTCTKCGGQLKKLISNTAFVLKGEGWYVTDYPSKDRKAALDKEKPATESKDASVSADAKKPETTSKPETTPKETSGSDTASKTP
ncbi:MAG: zinc ribbon domain-containing protein [Nitrospirae bacterium YQR-1]